MTHDTIRDHIQRWLAGTLLRGRLGLRAVGPKKSISAHVDELFPEMIHVPPAEMLETACAAFAELVGALGPADSQTYMARMTVALTSGTTFDRDPPAVEAIPSMMTPEPPELFIASRDLDQYLWPVEQYVRPFDWPAMQLKLPFAWCSYHVLFSPDGDPTENHPFLQVRHYPPEFR